MFGTETWIHYALTEIYALALMAFVFRRQILEEKQNVWLKILLAMFAMYMGLVFYSSLVPSYFYRRFRFSLERLNLVPFRALHDWLANPFNFFGNVLLFMPLGFFEVLLHPAATRRRQLLMTAGASVSLSLFIGFAKCFNYRVPDIDDLLLNLVGSVLGALLCMLQQKLRFDETRVGRVLLPRIPRTWRYHMRLNRFCILFVVTMEAALFTVNYIVTVPKPEVKVNTAAENAAAPVPETEVEAPGEATAEPPETEEATPLPTPEPTAAPKRYATAGLELEARNILLVERGKDGEDDRVIFASGSEDMIYPASTLKMLTALTVLDIADPGETVRVGEEIYIPPLDAARAGLEYGMSMSVKNLLECLLLPSGADAAYALGVYCGRKLPGNSGLSGDAAVSAFVAEMNRKAEALGAGHTTAVNVVGLDAKGQLTTAEDILTIAKAFLDQPVLAEICGLPKDRVTSEEGKSITLKNTNKMLIADSGYYNGSIAGVKTGTTNKAGNCLVSVFDAGGEEYLCIVMNSSYYGKFTDTQALFEVCAAAE